MVHLFLSSSIIVLASPTSTERKAAERTYAGCVIYLPKSRKNWINRKMIFVIELGWDRGLTVMINSYPIIMIIIILNVLSVLSFLQAIIYKNDAKNDAVYLMVEP